MSRLYGLKRINRGRMRLFKPIHAGKYWVSVQGSDFSYSVPREYREHSEEYSALEVAVFKGRCFDKARWVIPPKELKEFRWVGLFDNAPYGSTSVAGYVPVSIIKEIIRDLKHKASKPGRKRK